MSLPLKKSLKKLNINADWIGLRQVHHEETHLSVRNEKLDSHHTANNLGCMVEVMIDGHFAYCTSQDTSQESLQFSAEKALSLAKKSAAYKVHHFTQEQRPPIVGDFVFRKKIDSQSYVEIYNRLTTATKKMNSSPNIITAIASADINNLTTEFVSSNGSELRQEHSYLSLDQLVSAQKNQTMQSRSNGSKVGQDDLNFFNKDALYEDSERIGLEVLELLDAKNCPTDTCDIVIMPDQLYLQIHESIGHPLELDRILGDERNYAGWSFVKPEDIGTLQYGSHLLNITFSPQTEGELASYHFDDTGAKAEKKYLIKDGVLICGIGGLESQTRIGKPGTSSSRSSSWNRAPIDRMGNINLEPGDCSLEQMISNVEKGLLIFTNKSWSIDDYRNKFQFGCEYGKLIEDGRITATVKNPNYKGCSIPFWKSLKMLGSHETSETLGSFYCGKGEPNQVIRVGHKTPPALFSSVEVFGGNS